MQPSIRYQPFQASPRALALYAVATAALGAYVHFRGATLFPPHDKLALLFVILVVLSPVMILQLGWAYELHGGELVVLRFGKERHRLPLAEYRGRTSLFQMPRLEFQTRTIWLVSGIDDARQEFLLDFDHAVEAAGGGSREPVVRHVGPDAVRLRVVDIRVPDARCVACDSAGTHTAHARAERGIALLRTLELNDIPLPVCARHRALHLAATPLLYAATFVIATVVSGLAVFASSSQAILSGALLVGCMGGALACVVVKELVRLRRFADWHVLGFRADEPSADLVYVTLRVRSDELRARIAARAKGAAASRTFG